MMDFDYCEEYLTSISNKMLLWLRKANFHSLDICKLMKNQSCKKRSSRKPDSNFKFFLSCPFAHEVSRRKNVMHITEFFLH